MQRHPTARASNSHAQADRNSGSAEIWTPELEHGRSPRKDGEAQQRATSAGACWCSNRSADEENLLERPAGDLDDNDEVTASRSVGVPERLMVEMSRMAVDHVEGRRVSDEVFLSALLGEAQATLLGIGARPIVAVVVPDVNPESQNTLAPDSPCATVVSGSSPAPKTMDDPPLPRDVDTLDRQIRRCGRMLAERDLRLGRLVRTMFAKGGWRVLGFGTRAEYAKERLGVSLSSLEHRALLARRAEVLPALATALTSGKIGYEAALLISRIPALGPVMADAWIDRARRRTILHLREEVDAVRLRWALDREASCAPPNDAVLAEIAELERKIQSGEIFSSLLGAARLRGPQASVTLPAGAGSRLKLRVSVELRAYFNEVEAEFRRLAGPDASFVAFMCICLWDAWLPWLQARDDKWKAVFTRDRHRCSSPVCRRTDITPHHLVFRAHGGGDEAENMALLCAWCHLQGIHGGRITALPPASSIHWLFGRASSPVLEVLGREVVSRAA